MPLNQYYLAAPPTHIKTDAVESSTEHSQTPTAQYGEPQNVVSNQKMNEKILTSTVSTIATVASTSSSPSLHDSNNNNEINDSE